MEDLVGGIAGVSSKPMFGGYGIYKDGVIFAIIADGALFFKVVNFSVLITTRFTFSSPFGNLAVFFMCVCGFLITFRA